MYANVRINLNIYIAISFSIRQLFFYIALLFPVTAATKSTSLPQIFSFADSYKSIYDILGWYPIRMTFTVVINWWYAAILLRFFLPETSDGTRVVNRCARFVF